MNDGGNAMSEKEFLENFIIALANLESNKTVFLSVAANSAAKKFIDEFLEEHHKEYYEVEFVKKGSDKGNAIELLNTMQQFKTKLEEDDDYDYAADDMNYDAAREKKYK